MPFIPKDRRIAIALGEDPKTPGEYCYVYYKYLVDRWVENPCWTTVHELYTYLCSFSDTMAPHSIEKPAMELAWQVFFAKYVMPYEDKKEQENGTI